MVTFFSCFMENTIETTIIDVNEQYHQYEKFLFEHRDLAHDTSEDAAEELAKLYKKKILSQYK